MYRINRQSLKNNILLSCLNDFNPFKIVFCLLSDEDSTIHPDLADLIKYVITYNNKPILSMT